MKKVAAFLANTLLFIPLLLAVGMAFVFIGSYLNIIFKFKFEAPPYLYVFGLLWLGAAIILYIAPKRRYGSLPGSAIVLSKEETGRRPIIFYAVVIAALLLSYFAAQIVNATIFGRMASKQEQKLEAAGMSLNWKGYFPGFPYTDPDNASPFLKEAVKGFGEDISKETDRLWKLVAGEEVYDFSKVSSDVTKLSASAAKPASIIKKALGHKKLLWNDYRAVKESEFFTIEIPQYSGLRTYAKLKMLEVIAGARKGDWQAAGLNVSRVAALSNLLKQDPTMIAALIRLATLNTILDGLMVSAKTAPDKHAALEFVRKVVKDLPDVKGGIGRSLMLEYAGNAAAQKAVAGEAGVVNLFFGTDEDFKDFKEWVLARYYRAFGLWDRYILLRTAEFHIKIAGERDAAARKKLIEELEAFAADRHRLPALMTAISAPSFTGYISREFYVEMRKDVVMIFVSSLDYKRKYGHYPKTPEKLVPGYMPALPASPLDGKPYGYRTAGALLEVYAEDAEGKRLPLPSFK